MLSKSKLQLIPWDPESPHHVQRLFEQRLQCGWHEVKVDPEWRDEQRAGKKCLYWICFAPGDAEAEEKIRIHTRQCPKEETPILDTSAAVRGAPRRPSMAEFHPIGHISLDTDDKVSMPFNMDLPDKAVYWIKTFYISNALQNQGLGREAMDMIEAMAVEPPLCAKVLALDTVHRDDYLAHPEFYTAKGLPPRKMSNHEWYRRRGYREIKVVQNYYQDPDENGKVSDIKTVFMRRDIT